MRRDITATLITTTAAVVLLAGCGERGEPAQQTETAGRTSTEAPQVRILVGSDTGVDVVDAADLETVDRFPLASRPKLIAAGDDRHVFALQYDAKKVSVVDSGTWSEAHGDHSHSYVARPAVRKTTFDLGTSYHAVSDDERSVVWFDDDGSFVSFDWKGLEDDDVDETRIETKSPHHGVAVPTSDGGFIASIAEAEEAIGVALLDAEGNETKRIEECPGLHGEAHIGDDAYAFGCATGVLVVDEGDGASIAAPLEGAGTGTLAPDHDSDILVGDLYSESDERASTHLSLYDLGERSARAVDLGVEVSGFGRSDGQTVALGTDGALHVIDDESGKVVKQVPVIEPWQKSDDFAVPRPQVAVAEGLAYVTDPRDRSITVWEIGTGEQRERAVLEDVPTSLVLINTGHSH